MSERNRHHGQFTQNNQDCEYIKISLLKRLEPDKTSGKYWYLNAMLHIK